MCGRFAIFSKPADYLATLKLDDIPSPNCETVENFNAFPSQNLPTLYRNQDHILKCESLHWGLIPAWSKDTSIGFKTSNARSETAAEKPSFSHAFIKQRCLIPVDGWYEWKREGKDKQPYFHHKKDNNIIWLAGLWESWNNPNTNEELRSFTILTQDATGNASKIHNRMPVIINPECASEWLDEHINEIQNIYELMHYMPQSDLEIYPVTKTMNSPKHNSIDCIKNLMP